MESAIAEIEIQKYEAYKESGIEWLGEVPKHWLMLPGSRVVNERSEKNKGMVEKTVLSLSYGKVVIKPEEKLVGLVPESFETYQLVYPGDIIIRPTDLQNDKTSLRTGLAKDNGIITSAYINLRVNENYSSRFYHYFLYALDITKMIYSLGSGLRQNLSYEDFKKLNFLVPPPVEQTAIANFLDRKIVQIDQAIAQKESLIELLQERRQILIQRAVTRGLNPDAPMKDTGVEWIGEVPAHWDLKRLGFLTEKIGDGLHGTPMYTDNTEYYFINGNNLSKGYINITAQTKTVSEKEYLSHKINLTSKSLLLSINGTIGNVAYFKGEKVMLGKSAAYLNFYSNVNIDFVKIFMGSLVFKNYFELELSGSTINNLSLYSIGKAVISMPPNEEQEKIVNWVNANDKLILAGVAMKEREILSLKEYKFTLINAAVTGKIKVC